MRSTLLSLCITKAVNRLFFSLTPTLSQRVRGILQNEYKCRYWHIPFFSQICEKKIPQQALITNSTPAFWNTLFRVVCCPRTTLLLPYFFSISRRGFYLPLFMMLIFYEPFDRYFSFLPLVGYPTSCSLFHEKPRFFAGCLFWICQPAQNGGLSPPNPEPNRFSPVLVQVKHKRPVCAHRKNSSPI